MRKNILHSLLLPQHEIILQSDDEKLSDSDDEEGSEEIDEKIKMMTAETNILYFTLLKLTKY